MDPSGHESAHVIVGAAKPPPPPPAPMQHTWPVAHAHWPASDAAPLLLLDEAPEDDPLEVDVPEEAPDELAPPLLP